MLVTDESLVGSYTASLKLWIYGDNNSTTYSNAGIETVTINVVYCTPNSTNFSPTLPPITYNIGNVAY
jgi:hypothetical protein